jgi:hypothetical protein
MVGRLTYFFLRIYSNTAQDVSRNTCDHKPVYLRTVMKPFTPVSGSNLDNNTGDYVRFVSISDTIVPIYTCT